MLFSTAEAMREIELESSNRIHRFLQWLMNRGNRVAAWIGRVMNSGYGYYLKLEDRIDPQERVLKAVAEAEQLVIYHPLDLNSQVRIKFDGVLRKQRLKHIFWFAIDLVVCGVVIVFTPILAPIPGPNVFFYYPFLRLLGHYRAILGASQGLRSTRIEFKSLPDFSGLEENLPGLRTFLHRVS